MVHAFANIDVNGNAWSSIDVLCRTHVESTNSVKSDVFPITRYAPNCMLQPQDRDEYDEPIGKGGLPKLPCIARVERSQHRVQEHRAKPTTDDAASKSS